MHRRSSWLLLLAGVLVIASGGCGSQADSPDAKGSADAKSVSQTGATAPGSKARRNQGDPLHPRVVLHTSRGDITLRLDAENAPLTVSNFLDYVDNGHFNGLIFHQVVNGYIVLGGGFTPDLQERSTRPAIRNEAHNGLQNRRGTVAMARSLDAIDSATCQFFINLDDNETLDYTSRDAEGYGFCVFGEVIGGMDVVDAMAKVPVQDVAGFEMVPTEPIVITSAHRAQTPAPRTAQNSTGVRR